MLHIEVWYNGISVPCAKDNLQVWKRDSRLVTGTWHCLRVGGIWAQCIVYVYTQTYDCGHAWENGRQAS